jgi:tetratricopeptide (TPR) repeat protein
LSAALLLAVLGGAATFVKAFGIEHWIWLSVTAAAVVAAVAVPTKLLLSRIERADKRTEDQRLTVSATAVRIKVRDVKDPVMLGVHRAVTPEGVALSDDLRDGMPVYVPRDVHEDVAAQLKPGGFVLLVGDSAAGKSRLAFEAISQVLGAHVLFAPEPTGLLASIEEIVGKRDAVLWLDDLERFLVAEHALTTTAVDRVLGGPDHRRVIIATLRLQELEALDREPESDSDRVSSEGKRRVLALAIRVPVSRAFTKDETERARNRAHDPRIAEALTHSDDYGLAEYLGAGPQLLQRWLDGKESKEHRRGAALVEAAVECRRAGFLSPLPRALLTEAHTHYLPTTRAMPEDLEAAWSWVEKRWRGSVALLEPGDKETVHAFDYVVDHVQRTKPLGDHILEAVVLSALNHASTADMASIADIAYAAGRYHLAHTAYSQVVSLRSDQSGPNDLSVLSNRNSLALVLRELGRFAEAEVEHRAVLQIREELGGDRSNTLTVRNNLALVLGDLGRFVEAEAEARAVFEIRVRELGADHLKTLTSQNNLASALQDLGRLVEAEVEYQAVLEVRMRILGARHPETLATRNNLASVLGDLGRFAEAEAEARAVFEIQVRELGADHPKTLTSRNNFGLALQKLERFVEAEVEYQAVVEGRMRVLGAGHPATLTVRNNLASVLLDLGRLAEAEAELRAVLEARSRMLGVDHPDTLLSRSYLGSVLHRLGRLAEAAAEYRVLLEARTRVLGVDHPKTVKALKNLDYTMQQLRGSSGAAADEAAT